MTTLYYCLFNRSSVNHLFNRVLFDFDLKKIIQQKACVSSLPGTSTSTYYLSRILKTTGYKE